ncbi:MAG: hypothetical protein GKR97_02920 [Rhizobiaceae bacterium]|nr:hypothetical protein [Rhizobiaceae bacterium]
MNDLSITFAPLFPWSVIAVLSLAAGLLVLYGLWRGVRGSWIRLAAFAALALALSNPSLLQEDRDPLKTVVAVIVDETDSQKFDGRDEQTAQARSGLTQLLQRFPQFEIREVIAKNGGDETEEATSALFSVLKKTLQDVPPEQVGGAIFLTDGQTHDIPENVEELGFNAPIHSLISGDDKDRDRRLVIKRAPRFGIVGGNQEIVYSVIDTNIDTGGGLVNVRVLIDGELAAIEQVFPGEESSFFFDVPHGGKNVIELHAELVDGEITPVNNQAFSIIDGIRENLRVLLVSGEPHAGERTWRNLLKSDASVDLVHFTILRPPEKQDGTPINQLSLIAFPTRELFIEKIDEFDLIIFDRYQRRGVLPLLYFDNISRYLVDGGAILIAAGPEHADLASIHRTPLAPVLPVEPTGEVSIAPFHPTVSEAGRRHPVTRGLEGLRSRDSKLPPNWSRWFRLIDGTNPQGDIVMEAGDEKPLLVLNRPGEGRIAMLMSDHVWLWARGFEGGGPHTQLLRRLGHWLMKEPELEEEALRAEAAGNRLVVKRQTMGDKPGRLDLITPTGEAVSLEFIDKGDGRFEAEYESESLGLFRAANGELTALAHVGPTNPREYADIVSTGTKLSSISEQTGGLIKRISRTTPAASLPRIVPVRGNAATRGNDWIGLRTTSASVLNGVIQIPLLAGFLGLGILLLLLSAMWVREGR